jgi:hypothetical protein
MSSNVSLAHRASKVTWAGPRKNLSTSRKRNHKSNPILVEVPWQMRKRKDLLGRIDALKKMGTHRLATPQSDPLQDIIPSVITEESHAPESTHPTTTAESSPEDNKARCPVSLDDVTARWSNLLPSLLPSFLSYRSISTGRAVTPVGNVAGMCTDTSGRCASKTTKIMCLYFDRKCNSCLCYL